MSSPLPPRPAHPTRQQLDELDALLRRMLDVPESAAAAPAPPEGPPAPPPGPAVSYRVIQQAAPSPPGADAPPEEEQWVPLRSAWQPSPHTWGPLAESWQQAQAGRGTPAPPRVEAPPPPPAPPAREGAIPPPIIRPVSGFVQRLPEPTGPEAPGGPPVSRWLLPLVWCNRAFDALTAPLGAPGRWLRGRTGRAVLGAVGLVCLAAAVARAVADGIGWTW
jgi:hypothetical protein